MMTFLKHAFVMLTILIAGTSACLAADKASGKTTLRIVAQDPEAGATLAAGDRLFLHISYESTVPVRFQAEALRQDVLQEDAFTNSAPPYDAGSGEALASIGFSRQIRIDTIRVTAFDLEWQQLASVTVPMVLDWDNSETDSPREPASWVGPMQKHHRHVFDTALDPLPRKPQPLFDVFLLISVISIPIYVLVQIRMLFRYEGGWRNYAIVPLVPILPLCLYSLIGLGMESSYWIIFLTGYTPVSLAYLGILWLVKRNITKPGAAANPP
jgi:hypothetical protein